MQAKELQLKKQEVAIKSMKERIGYVFNDWLGLKFVFFNLSFLAKGVEQR